YNQFSATEEDISGSLIGYTRATLDEIYDLYCQHALLQGTDIITEKQFVCSTVGKTNHSKKEKKEKKSQTIIKESTTEESTKKKTRRERRVVTTRTECCALIREKLNNQGQYEMIHHSLAHNHPLTRQQWNHLDRSKRTMTREKEGLIETMQEAGLGVKANGSYRSFELLQQAKMKPIEGGDAQSVIGKLYQNMSHDLEFFSEYVWMIMEGVEYILERLHDERVLQHIWRCHYI
ncbi:Protein FAR1-RELATED SEQUENCE 5, partial [Bienertia sinuspersici]